MGQSISISLLFHISYNTEVRGLLQLTQQLGRNGDTYPTKYPLPPHIRFLLCMDFGGEYSG